MIKLSAAQDHPYAKIVLMAIDDPKFSSLPKDEQNRKYMEAMQLMKQLKK